MDVFFGVIQAITQGTFGGIIIIAMTIVTALAINREPNKMPILLFPIAFAWHSIGIGIGSIYAQIWIIITGIMFALHILYDSKELVQRITHKAIPVVRSTIGTEKRIWKKTKKIKAQEKGMKGMAKLMGKYRALADDINKTKAPEVTKEYYP